MRKAVWIAVIIAVATACGFGFKAHAAAAADIAQAGTAAPTFSFKLLADPDHKVVDAYGVPLMTHGDMKFAARDTFLISPSGKIVKVWEKVDPNVHSTDVLAEIAANKK